MTKYFSGFASLALGFILIGCGSDSSGLKRAGAAGQPCTAGDTCDPGLFCRASDHSCVAPLLDAAPPTSADANGIGGSGQPCRAGNGCDPGLSCLPFERICAAPLPDAAPPPSPDANVVGAAGQACTTGGGCDPGLSCRASDHICVAPLPDATPPDSPDATVVGAAGQACTAGGGCDPGLTCRASDRICVTPLPDAAPSVGNCSNGPLGGMRVPAGTLATANATYLTSTPDMAVDGAMTTGWNSGGYSGWLKLQFPKPTAISAIHIHASASPTTDEIYTITADSLATIGSATRRVVAGTAGSTIEPIPVIPGTYSAITITINGGSSWVQIYELTLINDECPLK